MLVVHLPSVVAAREDGGVMTEDEWIERALAELPPLSDRQRQELAALISGRTLDSAE